MSRADAQLEPHYLPLQLDPHRQRNRPLLRHPPRRPFRRLACAQQLSPKINARLTAYPEVSALG